ncbi:MAG: uroporphyrinogen-III C-methyltransferase [Gammaproteobacteria bacterium]|nr:uroporphyrinogen-III C-methyltransferase [Gammaproteobacteria bacterium]
MHIDNKPVADEDATQLRDSGSIEPPAPAVPAPASSGRGRSWAFGIAFLALLCAGGGIVAGFILERQLDARLQAQARHTEELATALKSAGQRQDEFAAQLAGVGSQVPEVVTELAEIGALLQRDAQQRVEPADVERLLRMANDSLQLAGDVDTAQRALSSADRRLQALGDPLFAEVRRRLAQEISAVAAAPRPDIPGMAYSLAGLQAELGSLLLRHETLAPPDAEGPTAPDTATAELPQWRAVLRDMWAALRSLVVVRRREGGELPLIAPGEQVFLTQNLYLKLESARIALLARDDRNFHASLAAAQSWLREYYDIGAPAVAAVASSLHAMDQVNITPPLPEISGSLEALRAALTRRRGASSEDAGA